MKNASRLIDPKKPITVAVLGSHSALEVCAGAKAMGLKTLVVCEKGRDSVYSQTYKTRTEGDRTLGVVDDVLLLDKFSDILKKDAVSALQKRNSVFVPHRSFQVYTNFNYDAIENDFAVPILGSRMLLRAEERTQPRNQYYLMKKAGVRYPQQFKTPSEIDRLCIVKVSEAQRTFERSFFFASNVKDFEKISAEKIKKGEITKAALDSAVIEEFIIGVPVNFNYFYSPLSGRTEILGTDARRQTSIDGFLRLPADLQQKVSQFMSPSFEESGHYAVTILESMVGQCQEMGEKFAAACQKGYAPGIIGPFALQCAVLPGPPKKVAVVFDVSMRMPGSPGIQFTPYTGYLYGEQMSAGKRLAYELQRAVKEKRLDEILT